MITIRKFVVTFVWRKRHLVTFLRCNLTGSLEVVYFERLKFLESGTHYGRFVCQIIQEFLGLIYRGIGQDATPGLQGFDSSGGYSIAPKITSANAASASP